MVTKNRVYEEGQGMPLAGIRKRAVNELNEFVYTGKIKVKRVSQCFCKKSDFELLSRYDRYGLPFGTQICLNCGLIAQTIQLEDESMPLFYDKLYWPMNMGSDDPNLQFTPSSSLSEFISLLVSELKTKSGDISVYEVGCGNGIRLAHLREVFKDKLKVRLFGCDYSTSALSNATGKGIETIYGGMESMLEKGPADVLILSNVFEHFTNLHTSLDLIDKLTHDDSIIYVEVPGVLDLKNKREYSYDYQTYTVLAHIHNFSLTTLSNVFAMKGFKLVKGTEYVRAVFRKNVKIPQPISSNPYQDIIQGISDAQKRNQDYMKRSSNPIIKYGKGLIKAFLGRV
jgi:SAM-dependent methyltransferase